MQTFNGTHQSGILLACMPKSGSSSTARMISRFPNVRTAFLVPAFDIREQEIDIKILEQQLAANVGRTFVAQTHVCLSNTTRSFIDGKLLLPLVSTRNLPDDLISSIDHYAQNDNTKENFLLPVDFQARSMEEKIDYVIHFQTPWLLKFFKSWSRYERFGEVWLKYEDLARDNMAFLRTIPAMLGLDYEIDTKAGDGAERLESRRLNRGVNGRGRELMSPAQLALIERMVVMYDIPQEYRGYLLYGE
ncbi:hypothetical protein E3C22_14150 [Jiella endophytica]|uniref:Sulfotransferase domain-containing protein n=1 Tax=Jiella endophytica TaxID=2558362 RepID=A0A4Y8RGC9_9HYPH|nr:hypothetical protein [Jiella endophytica]TFF21813.1 hypothetical protein E3C22_14150 [Jiella endophytica]